MIKTKKLTLITLLFILPVCLSSSVYVAINASKELHSSKKSSTNNDTKITLSSLWSTDDENPTICQDVNFTEGMKINSSAFLYSIALNNIKTSGVISDDAKAYFYVSKNTPTADENNTIVTFEINVYDWAASYVDGTDAYLKVTFVGTTANKVKLTDEVTYNDGKVWLTELANNPILREKGYYTPAQNYASLRNDLVKKFTSITNPNQITFGEISWDAPNDAYCVNVKPISNSTYYDTNTDDNFNLYFNYKRVVLDDGVYNVAGSATSAQLKTSFPEYVANPSIDEIESQFKNINKDFFKKVGQTDAEVYSNFKLTFDTLKNPDDPTSANNNGTCNLVSFTGSEDYTVNFDKNTPLLNSFTVKIKPNLIDVADGRDKANINISSFPAADPRDTASGDIYQKNTSITLAGTTDTETHDVMLMIIKPLATDIRYFLIEYDTKGLAFLDGTAVGLNPSLNWNEIDINVSTNVYGTAKYGSSSSPTNVYKVTINAKSGSLVYTPTDEPLAVYVLLKYWII